MKISIITVVYNNVETVEDAIRSVLRQTHRDREYLVIDGASTDGTLERVKRYRDQIDQLVSEPDSGIYDAMNKGISLATGDVIGILNSDDVYQDESVLSDVAAVFADPAVEACYGDLVYVDKKDLSRIIRYWQSCRLDPRLLLQGWMPPHPTFYVRKRVYDQFGGFDLSYRRAADYELTIRFLYKHSIRAVYIPRVLVRMRLGGASNNNFWNILKQNVENIRAARENGLPCNPVSLIFHKIIARLQQFFRKPEP
ncbi:MAG: glycosyltransferase family 2 protein [Nitrospinaceae bacterium]